MIEKTGGGLLVAPDSAEALAEGLYALWKDAELARTLGNRAFEGVRAPHSLQHSADRLMNVYEPLVARPMRATG